MLLLVRTKTSKFLKIFEKIFIRGSGISDSFLTFNLASCGPLNAVRGRFSSEELPFSLGGFLGRLVRGPILIEDFI